MALLRISHPDGEFIGEFEQPSLPQVKSSVLFALQRQVGETMPFAMDRSLQAGDLLTWLYYQAWIVLWTSGRKPKWADVIELDVDVIPTDEDEDEPADADGTEGVEADPTAAPTASDRGGSADEA